MDRRPTRRERRRGYMIRGNAVVIIGEMAPGYDPPSASLNPPPEGDHPTCA